MDDVHLWLPQSSIMDSPQVLYHCRAVDDFTASVSVFSTTVSNRVSL